jgi:hypothetical protein
MSSQTYLDDTGYSLTLAASAVFILYMIVGFAA